MVRPWQNSPRIDSQAINVKEVSVPADQNQFVTRRGGGDPDVVFRNGPPFLLKTSSHTPVRARHVEITRKNGPAGRKSLHFGRVLCRAAGFRGSEKQLAHYDRGK
jgi:hypothetical protein